MSPVLVGRSWKVSLKSSGLIKGISQSSSKKCLMVWAWWLMPVIQEFQKLKQEDVSGVWGQPGLCSEVRARARLRGGRQLRELLCLLCHGRSWKALPLRQRVTLYQNLNL